MRVGLPKGRLIDTSTLVLNALGLDCGSSLYRVESKDVSVWLLKMRDIPHLVESGELDLGLAPDEWIEEAGPRCERVAPVDGYVTRVSVLAPVGRPPRLDTPEDLCVATEFPNLTRRYFARRWPRLRVLEVHGSAEAYAPGLADVVVDCVETGETAREHGLEELFTLIESRLHVIVCPELAEPDRRPDIVDLIATATGSHRPAAPTAR